MIPLKQIRVETPCEADWEGMEGTDQVRFCTGCRKNVYNLSAMTEAEAQQSLERPEGMPCVRFHHDAAGAPLTREAMPARRRFLVSLAGALLALIGGAASAGVAKKPGGLPPRPSGTTAGVPLVMGGVSLPNPPPVMGKIAPPKHPHPAKPPHRKDRRPRG